MPLRQLGASMTRADETDFRKCRWGYMHVFLLADFGHRPTTLSIYLYDLK